MPVSTVSTNTRVPMLWEQGRARHSSTEDENDAGPSASSSAAVRDRDSVGARLFFARPPRPWASMIRLPLLLAAIALVLSSQPAAAQTTQSPAIVTQGNAVVTQPPDEARITIAVEARGAKPEDARSQAASAMTAVLTAVKPLVAADAVKTSAFSVEPETEYPNGSPRVKDYVARNQLEVRVDDLDCLPRVLDASVASGATSIAGLRFDVKDRARWEKEALMSAVQDALGRAAAIAAGAGKNLGAILRIEEQPTSSPTPMFRFAAGVAASRPSPETPIAAGDIEIRAQVSLTVEIH